MNITRNLVVAVLMTVVTTVLLGWSIRWRSPAWRRCCSRTRPTAS